MIKILILFLFLLGFVITMPLAIIWSINNLISNPIPYNYYTWCSVLVLYILLFSTRFKQ